MADSPLNQKPYNHARSNSLPSKPHSLILQCNEHLATLGSNDVTSSSLLSLKLSGLRDLHGCIENLVQLSTVQEALTKEHQEKYVDELLDGSLRLLDACTSTKDALLHTKECTRELHSIIRRRRRGGEVEVMVEAKKFWTSRKIVKKAVLRVLENLTCGASKCSYRKDCETIGLVRFLKEGEVVTLSVFESLLIFISGSTQSKHERWKSILRMMQSKRVASCTHEVGFDDNEFAKIDAELQSFVFHMTRKSGKISDLQNQLEKLEPAIHELEEGLEFLFRRLIRIRVSLLNILNH